MTVETIDMDAALSAVTAVHVHANASLPALQAASSIAMPVTPADLLRMAMEREDKDLDRLERLMAMEERYRESQERERVRQSVLAYRRDFAGFRGENIIIPKTKEVDRGRGGSFMQAEYHVAADMLSPGLSKHGFAFRHDQKFGTRRWITDGVESDVPWVWVTCYLEHRDGHAETLTLEGPPGDLTVNTPVQNMQVTASFLKRQSLLAITGTATGGEDDESQLKRGASESANHEGEAEAKLVKVGQAKAAEGMKSLTDWWSSLTDEQRKRLTPYFGGMKAVARGVKS
jgi:hypothetical protein